MSALDGLRILDLSRLLPGPYCTLLLADLGADVVKVEDTGGGDYLRWMPPLADDGQSVMYHPVNRNKRSIALDLKNDDGRELFLRLCERADVVVESFRPGVMARLGLGWDVLHERNPRLILCSISGYGQDGPYRERAGHDIDYIAIGGALGMTGSEDGTPALPGVQIGDLGGGALGAAVAILAALEQRHRGGEGQWCDVSMLDGVVAWDAMHFARAIAEERSPGPGGHVLNGRHPCYRVYRCADGWLAVGALEPKFWAALTETIGLPHLASEGFAEGDAARRVVDEVEAVLKGRTRAEWMEVFGDRDVCVEPVLSLHEMREHPQVRARGLEVAAGEAGPAPQLAPPLRLSASPFEVRRPAPRQGEHTEELLAEIGIDASGYAELRTKGVIR